MADLMDRLNQETKGVRIVIAGKYTGLSDSYLSVIKGLHHASLHTGIKVFIDWIETINLEPGTREKN
jgi:CTP synthase